MYDGGRRKSEKFDFRFPLHKGRYISSDTYYVQHIVVRFGIMQEHISLSHAKFYVTMAEFVNFKSSPFNFGIVVVFVK